MLAGGANDNPPAQARTTLPIACSDCGQQGTIVWEASETARRLVEVSSGFHPETGRTSSGEVLIVCDACDMILPG